MRALPLAAAALLLLAGCTHHEPSALEQVRTRGELRVVTLNLPTCYYLGAQGSEGLEYQLASRFASQLGVKLTMYPVANESAMQDELAAGRADIAAASLSDSPDWQRVGDAAVPYAEIPQLVVYKRSGVRPRDTLQLESARLAVRAGSPQERILEKLRNTMAPTLQWVQTAPSSADPIDDVDSGGADYAITDAREFSFAHHLYPNVLVGFALPDTRPVQWFVRKGATGLTGAASSSDKSIPAPESSWPRIPRTITWLSEPTSRAIRSRARRKSVMEAITTFSFPLTIAASRAYRKTITRSRWGAARVLTDLSWTNRVPTCCRED